MRKLSPIVFLLAFGISMLAAEAVFAGDLTGTIRFEDRSYAKSGFLGYVYKNVKYARVTVEYGGNTYYGATDVYGYYTVALPNDGETEVDVTVFTASPDTYPNGNAAVTAMNGTTQYSSSVTATVNTNGDTLDFDVPRTEGEAGEGFNILDCVNDAFMFVDLINGGEELSHTGVNVRWAPGNTNGTWYDNGVIQLYGTVYDPDEWDDDVIMHEVGHFVMNTYSRDDSPGGMHYIYDPDQDPRLAYSEGWAYFFSSAIKRFRGDGDFSAVQCDYRGGAMGWFNIDDFSGSETSSYAPYAVGCSNELSVAGTMWDLTDIGYPIPQADDDPYDSAFDIYGVNGVNDSTEYLWYALRTYIPAATSGYNPSTAPHLATVMGRIVDCWVDNDELFHGTATRAQQTFAQFGMDYFEDACEPNETSGTAYPLETDGREYNLNFYNADPGQATDDWFYIDAVAGEEYSFHTYNLLDNCDTALALYNGALALLTSDNDSGTESGNTYAAIIVDWTAPSTGTYYLRVYREQSVGIDEAYGQNGAYSLKAVRNYEPAGPTASVSPSASAGYAPLSVSFTGSGSGANGIVKYEYDFDGDGVFEISSTESGSTNQTLSTPGVHAVVFRVIDSAMRTAIEVARIDVRAPNAASFRAALRIQHDAFLPLSQGETVGIIAAVPFCNREIVSYSFDFDSDGTWDYSSTTAAGSIGTSFDYTRIPAASADTGEPALFRATVKVTFENGISILRRTQPLIIEPLPVSTVNPAANPNVIGVLPAGTTDLTIPTNASLIINVTVAGTTNESEVAFDFDGDGLADKTDTTSIPAGGGNSVFSASHTYTEPGLYTPLVTVFSGDESVSVLSPMTGPDSRVYVGLDNTLHSAVVLSPRSDSTVSGYVVAASARVLSGPTVTSARFLYRTAGGGGWSVLPASDLHVDGSNVYAYFDSSDIEADEGLYDIGLELNGETIAGAGVTVTIDNSPDAQPTTVGYTINGDPVVYSVVTGADLAGGSAEIKDIRNNAVVIPSNFDGGTPVTAGLRDMLTLGALPPENATPVYEYLNVTLTAGVIPAGEVAPVGGTVTEFNSLEVRMSYPDFDQDGVVDDTDVNETDLTPFHYAGGGWTEVSSATVDTLNNQVIFTVSHLSTFGLFVVDDQQDPSQSATVPAAGGGGGGGGGGCFIATACYGSYEAWMVKMFRRFRDETMLSSTLGEALVAEYYDRSPTVARFLERRPFARALVRKLLGPLGETIEEKE